MTTFQKKRLWYLFRRSIPAFIGSRLLGWFVLSVMVFTLTTVEIAQFLSNEIDAHFVCTPKG